MKDVVNQCLPWSLQGWEGREGGRKGWGVGKGGGWGREGRRSRVGERRT